MQRQIAVHYARRMHSILRRSFSTKLGGEVAPGGGRLTDLSGLGPKRFYEHVDVSEAGPRRFAVTIDGRTVKTPRMTPLELPTLPLATAVASEWDAQEDRIRPASMPLTTLVSTANDIIPAFRPRVVASTLNYLHTDTVCIRPGYPSELVSLQARYLDPIAHHFERKGIALNVAIGSLNAPQSAPTADAFRELIESADDYSLAALESATATAKSLLVAAAMRDGALDAEGALQAARSEEQWQSGVWGVVEGGHDMDDADTLVRLSAADMLFRFVEMDPESFAGNESADINSRHIPANSGVPDFSGWCKLSNLTGCTALYVHLGMITGERGSLVFQWTAKVKHGATFVAAPAPRHARRRRDIDETPMTSESSAKTVSGALKETNGDLVKTIATLSDKWTADLQSAKTKARDLHGTVLRERQSLQESLGTAARLWGVLRAPAPRDCHLEAATAEQRDAAVALRNVTQTLQFLDFFDGIPAALDEAHGELARIISDGATKFVAGNASTLYNVHAMLAAVERLRDVCVLESFYSGKSEACCAPEAVARVEETRKELDEFLMQKVFGDILNVSQSNPRFLVSAVRIVLQEEERDAWREKHLASHKLESRKSVGDVFLAREYKKRFFEAVGSQINDMFLSMDRSLSLNTDMVEEVTPNKPAASPNAEEVLEWLNARIADNDLVQRFVAPCLPSAFGISAFYEAKLHHRMMTTLLGLLRKITESRSEIVQQDAMIKFLLWYSSYRQGLGSDYSGIDSYLDDRDRLQLVSFMREHVATTVGTQIALVLDADLLSCQEEATTASRSDVSISQRDHTISSNVPEAVFGAINEIVGRASTLGVRAVQKAVAIGIADSLHVFQSKFAQALTANAEQPVSVKHPVYVCSVANNMAGCLELAEELRDNLTSSMSDDDRIDVIAALETSVEGFRKIAILAVNDLTRGVEQALLSLTCKLFAPHTGTDIILDIVGTLDDSFQSLGKHLLPLHFEQLVSECLRSVVAYYVTPFLLLGYNILKSEYSHHETPRKSVISPEDRPWARSRSQTMSRDRAEVGSIRSRQRLYGGTGMGHGLLVMNSNAVVAQIDKDIENLTTFFQAKVELYQRKQFQSVLEPMHAIRALYTCAPTPADLVEAYQVAKASVRNAMNALSAKCGPGRRTMSVRVAEAIWSSRSDVNASVRDEAVLYSSEHSPNYGMTSKNGTQSGASMQRELSKRAISVSSRFSVDTLAIEDSGFLWSPSVSVQRKVFIDE